MGILEWSKGILEELEIDEVKRQMIKLIINCGQYKKRATPKSYSFLFAWRRPTLTGGEPPTTIGAEELNFRVRHGNGCDLFAIVTRRIFN
jgi:hypothetical protein